MKLALWVLLAMALAASPAVWAAQPDVAVLPAEVRGVVLFPDGTTPVDGLRVRVWNAETEEVVFRTRTDENGVFGIPKNVVERPPQEGEEAREETYYVTVGPVRIDMRVLTARAGVTPQAHGFVVVIPKRMPLITPIVPSAVSAAATIPQIVSP